jgi:inositol hexakisphosphate/diphosphoinositol-pentakisphosphate kinase
VLAVIRHGDRTPKQKVKVKSSEQLVINLLLKHKDGKGRQAKLKTPDQLEELHKVVLQLLKVR